MAEETFYPEAGSGGVCVDGSVVEENTTDFATLRDGPGSSVPSRSSASGNYSYLRATAVNNQFNRLDRAIFTLLISGFTGNPDNITGAKFQFYPSEVTDAFGGMSLALVASAPANDNNIVAGDFDSLGNTRLASDLTLAGMTINQLNSFVLNAAGIAAIKSALSGDGILRLGVKLAVEISGSPTWADSAYSLVFAFFVDEAVAAKRPRLVITYTEEGKAKSQALIF